MKLLLTMGHHTPSSREHWQYDKAALVLLDWGKKKILRELTYVSPTGQRAHQGHMLFACGHLEGRKLLVTTHTEVLVIDVGDWAIESVFTHSHFNDLHHAIWHDGELYVCNTGLQAVQRFSADRKLLETVSAYDKPTWDVYNPDIDYRPLTTKPHPAHPNHLWVHDDQVWLTRANLRDAVQLRNLDRRLEMGVGMPHDGNLFQGLVWFTTTNGHVVGFDTATGERVRVVDLNSIDARGKQLGWCRAVRHLDDRFAFVGFSQFRRTKYRELAHWILNDGKGVLPSRIALYDLQKPGLLDEMDFSGPYEGSAIFSILQWPE